MKALFIFIHFLHILVSLFPFPFPFFLPAFLVYSLHCLHSSLPLFLPSFLPSFCSCGFHSFLILRKFVFDTYPHTCAIYGLSARIMEYHCAIYILYGLHLCHLLWVSAEFQLGSSAPIEQSPCHLLTGKKGTFYWNFTSSVPSIQGDLPS